MLTKAAVAVLIFTVWACIGLIGTVYISHQCRTHGYNGGGLNWDYSRYCNAEHYTMVPGPKKIPYRDVVKE